MAEAAVELRAILDSAERAASVQDFASAEHYLRQAAVIQEAQSGPTHPELANTLNNLGIVLERLGKPADAEASYRRAYAIASAALAPDDPLVITSGQNLRDFCAAAGKPFEVAPPPTPSAPAAVTPPASAVAAPPSPAAPTPPTPLAVTPPSPVAPSASKPVATQASAPAPAVPLKPVATPASSSKPVATKGSKPVTAKPSKTAGERPSKPVAAAASKPAAGGPSPVVRPVTPETPPAPAAVSRSAVRAQSSATARRGSLIWLGIATVLVILAIFWWFTSSSRTGDNENTTPAPATATPAPATETAATAGTAPPQPGKPESGNDVFAASRPAPPAVETAPPAAPSNRVPASTGAVSVVEAKLCRPLSLSDWQCTPVTNPTTPGGRLFFYTRMKASSDTTVQHRWYVNGGLLQSVNLNIRANAGAGFRTYSRNTVPAERTGTWTIELRDADGALLHEERFVVQ